MDLRIYRISFLKRFLYKLGRKRQKNKTPKMPNKYFLFLTITLFKFTSLHALIQEKVIICGVCRNVETTFPKTCAMIEEIGQLFQDYRVIVYENNSTDQTALLLKCWEARNNRVFIKSEYVSDEDYAKIVINQTWDKQVFRPERIAIARNKVLDIAFSPTYDSIPYVIWIDMDFEVMPNYEAIVEVFQNSDRWDGVLAYGIDSNDHFFDWYALRSRLYPFGPELLGSEAWDAMNKSLTLAPQEDWYPVFSAFGGLGIYKKSSIVGCKYAAVVTEELVELTSQLMKSEDFILVRSIKKYQRSCHSFPNVFSLPFPAVNLPPMLGDVGFKLFSNEELIWRMNCGVTQYPSVCEHVPFHASMIQKGHGKLFINPRLVMVYDKF